MVVFSQWKKGTITTFSKLKKLGFIKVTFMHYFFLFFQVVAHPISQHFITSIVFDNIPRWRTSTMKYKVFFIFMATLFYPITSFASIVSPYSSVGQLGKRPLVKFINVGSSFITFLCKHFIFHSVILDSLDISPLAIPQGSHKILAWEKLSN